MYVYLYISTLSRFIQAQFIRLCLYKSERAEKKIESGERDSGVRFENIKVFITN